MLDSELINALRVYNNPKGHRCSECPVFSKYEHGKCKTTVDRLSADRLEALTAENAALRAENERLKECYDAVFERAEKAEAERDKANICNGCAYPNTVGCHCARATWRGKERTNV